MKDCPYGEDENKCSYGGDASNIKKKIIITKEIISSPDNPCKNNNGGCSHTCTHLPTDAWRRSKKVQKGGFFNRLNIGKTPPPPTHKCLCPEGFELDCDNRTCVGKVGGDKGCGVVRGRELDMGFMEGCRVEYRVVSSVRWLDVV